MWEEWIFKTIIAFLSIQILQIVFGKYIGYAFKKTNAHGSGFKGFINSILVSMIPFLRWVFVGLMVIVIVSGIILMSEDKKNDE